MQRQDEIAVRAGKQAREHFYNSDARAQRRVNRAKFQPDVSAAYDKQATGDVFEIQSAGRVHHPRRIKI
jgi:hypothetical protein